MHLTPSSECHAVARRVRLGAACAWLLAAAAIVPAAQAHKLPDETPPAFGGLASATTCVPGPVGSGISTSYRLTWEAASDERTKTKRIVYRVYQASEPGGEDFSQATYVTRRGRTSFDTPALPSSQSYWFVVRAVDKAGNEDSNTVEREGMNLCV